MLRVKDKSGLTFDDVLIVPRKSSVIPRDVDTSVDLAPDIHLNMPIISAAMDTVTEHRLAIAMARHGGLGIIHRNMTAREQAEQVRRVKKSESGMILEPITIKPDQTIKEALVLMSEYHISGIPVISDNKKLLGIITNRDIIFEKDYSKQVEEVMTRENLVVAPVGTTLEEAENYLRKSKIEKLPIVDNEFKLKGLITIKDIRKRREYPHATKDTHGRLMVGAAVGTKDLIERTEQLVEAKVDLVVVDSAHGHSQMVLNGVEKLRKRFLSLNIVAGNVATKEGVRSLIEAGANIVKVGIGPGSICTTRVIAGAGVPQITAIAECTEEAEKCGVKIIADGGIRYSGDIVKALVAGASTIMVGSIFAGTEESPGESIIYQGRKYKVYRGMGSLGVMEQGTRDRYFQENIGIAKLVTEGIEGRVPYKGMVGDVLYQLVGGLKSGMGYAGCKTIEELRTKPEFIPITFAGLRESHVHNIIITREAPNYWLE
ncbi:MAG: IMP dehydrogenase [Campylobacterota bacterium]|nr:IMP dehydrogenase [Campylobacterota bacterium]